MNNWFNHIFAQNNWWRYGSSYVFRITVLFRSGQFLRFCCLYGVPWFYVDTCKMLLGNIFRDWWGSPLVAHVSIWLKVCGQLPWQSLVGSSWGKCVTLVHIRFSSSYELVRSAHVVYMYTGHAGGAEWAGLYLCFFLLTMLAIFCLMPIFVLHINFSK